MCLKTIKREIYSAKHIPRDPKKIDDNYQYMKMREARIAELEAQDIIDANANGMVIDVTPTALPEPVTPASGVPISGNPSEPAASPRPTAETAPAAIQDDGQTTLTGPTF